MFIKISAEETYKLPRDTWNIDGTLQSIAPHFNCFLTEDVYFVEDGFSLDEIQHEIVEPNNFLYSLLGDICKQYLDITDWMVIRESETGTAIPLHIKNFRAKIRTFIA